MANTEQALNKAREALEDSNGVLCNIEGEWYDVAQAQMADNGVALAALAAASAEAATPVDLEQIAKRWLDVLGYQITRPELDLVSSLIAAPQASQPIGQLKCGCGQSDACDICQGQPVSGAMTDELIERLALKHIATLYGKIGPATDYKQTEQFRRIKAYTMELLSASGQAVSEKADQEHNSAKLAKAIHDAAVKCGIIQDGTPLTGPQLIMLCDALSSTPAQQTEEKRGRNYGIPFRKQSNEPRTVRDSHGYILADCQTAEDAGKIISALNGSQQAVAKRSEGTTEAPVNVASELMAKVVETINDYINTNKLHAPLGERYTQEWVNGFDEALEGSRSPLIYRVKSIFDSLAAAPAPVQTQQSEKDAEDAARWRALLGSARIRPLGSAGIMKPEAGNYAHLGLELWTVFGRDYSQELLDRLDRENATGVEWLTKYADIAAIAKEKAK